MERWKRIWSEKRVEINKRTRRTKWEEDKVGGGKLVRTRMKKRTIKNVKISGIRSDFFWRLRGFNNVILINQSV